MKTAAVAPTATGTPLVAENLRKSFGRTVAVDGLSLALAAGELVGLVGPDGAGKTTSMRMLAGLVRPDSGEARVDGARVQDGQSSVREAIGYMPQQYSLYGDLSVGENLRFFGRLFGVPRGERAVREARLLDITRLARFRDRRADALSGGMYKKLALACALLHRPRVLLLDEPTNGVDPVSRRELWELLYEFVGEGMAVLLATPYMDEAARCHRVGLLHHGRLLAEGEPGALVKGFPHRTLLVHTERRDDAEDLLHDRPEVIALSPHGAALRVVVRAGREADFRTFTAGAALPMHLEEVAPDFEDVFLGLVSEPVPAPGGGA